MKYIIILILTTAFFSCKTTKFVEKEKIVIDSTAIKQRDALERTLKEERERFEKEKEEWDSLGVSFYETVSIPLDSFTKINAPWVVPTNKIEFENGRIKKIEGNIKSLNQSLYEKSSELYDAHRTIDSLQTENERLETQLSKKEVVVHREVERKTFIPWWVWVIVGGSLIVGTFFPQAKRFFKSKFNI